MVYTADNIKELYSHYPKVWGLGGGNYNTHDVYLIQSPVMNCQHFSIAGIEYLLRNLSKEEFRLQMIEIKKLIRKTDSSRHNCIIDITPSWVDQIEEYFKDSTSVLSKSMYTSSNGSIRVIMIISLKEFK